MITPSIFIKISPVGTLWRLICKANESGFSLFLRLWLALIFYSNQIKLALFFILFVSFCIQLRFYKAIGFLLFWFFFYFWISLWSSSCILQTFSLYVLYSLWRVWLVDDLISLAYYLIALDIFISGTGAVKSIILQFY